MRRIAIVLVLAALGCGPTDTGETVEQAEIAAKPSCYSARDCPPSNACAASLCVNGACVEVARPGTCGLACAAGLECNRYGVCDVPHPNACD